MRYLSILLICFCGCVGGPTHDYYNPAVVDAKFKGPIIMTLVDDVKAETEKYEQDGYTVIGTTDYRGKVPEAIELKKQAKRVGANRVIYSSVWVPPPPGGWNFRVGFFGPEGGTERGYNDVHIVFLGR